MNDPLSYQKPTSSVGMINVPLSGPGSTKTSTAAIPPVKPVTVPKPTVTAQPKTTATQPVAQRKVGGAAMDTPSKAVTKPAPAPAAQLKVTTPTVPSPTAPTVPSPTPSTPTAPPSTPAPAPSTPATPPESPYLKSIMDAIAAIKANSSPTALEAEDQQKLDDLITQQGNLSASKDLGLAAIKNQPIELGFQTGQASKLQQNVAAQMSALQAQMTPLQKQIALEQAKRTGAITSAQDIANLTKSASDITNPSPMSVSAGSSLVNPLTGQVMYQAPDKPMSVTAGSMLVDPTTGKVIASGGQKMTSDAENYALAQSQGFTGSFMDYMTAKGMSFQSDQGIAAMAQAVLNGQMAPSQIPGGGRGGLRLAVENAVLNQNPSFDFAGADSSFAFGKNSGVIQQVAKIGGIVNSGGAIDQLKQLSQAVSRSQLKPLNQITLAMAVNTGDPNAAAFVEGAKLLGDEIGNSLGASGSDLKVQLGLALADPSMSIEQLDKVLDNVKAQLVARTSAYSSVAPSLGGIVETAPTAGGTWDW